MLHAEGVIIRCKPYIRGWRNPDVPHVADNIERYENFRDRMAAGERIAPANNFPWKWRVAKETSEDAEQHF